MTQADEISSLKAQVAELTRRLDAKDAPPAPAKSAMKPIEDEGVHISTPKPWNDCFIAPLPDELIRLREAVLKRYPVLRPSNLDDEFESEKFAREFANTFHALSLVRRAEAVDTKRALWFWVDHLNEVGKAAGLPSIDGSALYAAAIGHSDILYVDPNAANMGVTRSLGLQFYGSGRRATDCWKRTLHGQILAPSIPPQTREFYPTPQPRVYYGAGY
jgi:hypothetical protein